MCGICGIYNLDENPVREETVQAMTSTLDHRGPDGQGIWLNGPVGLGHRRLSIIDLHTGDQPMGTTDGLVQVVFNGEIYNFLELRQAQEAKGHVFRTKSDTESILQAYREWGLDFVQHLRGMFAIALWDERRKKLVLARDRIGKKPLYYMLDEKRLVFGSEIKALLAVPGISRELDYQALDAYMSFGYIPSPMTIFKHIRKIPPAHVAVISSDDFKSWRYWHLVMESPGEQVDESEAVEELQEIFDDAVSRRLISDVPLGAFLSGGIDSSAVVASMALQKRGAAVQTAAVGFAAKEYDELEFAALVAKKYGTDHSEFVVEPNALSVLEKLVWHFDEPFADSSAIPTYYVSRMARKKVTVALSGDGGDETFAGYAKRYGMVALEDSMRRCIPCTVRQSLLRGLAAVYPGVAGLPRPLRLKSFLQNISRSGEEAYFRDMSFYFRPEDKRQLYQPWLSEQMGGVDSFEILGRHFAENHNSDAVSRAQYVDNMTYLPEDILVKVDRMSMANSLEVRSPILDHKVMEFAASLPSRLKLRDGESKYIFKKMNQSRLTPDILYRKKQG
ncbi:MAG: asparagine synthase (glutamine-hydrolyzing), partial [Desulfobia sp.]